MFKVSNPELLEEINYVKDIVDTLEEDWLISKIEFAENGRWRYTNLNDSVYLLESIGFILSVEKAGYVVSFLLDKKAVIPTDNLFDNNDLNNFFQTTKTDFKSVLPSIRIKMFKKVHVENVNSKIDLIDEFVISDDFYHQYTSLSDFIEESFNLINKAHNDSKKHPDEMTSNILYRLGFSQDYIPNYVTLSVPKHMLSEIGLNRTMSIWYSGQEFELTMETNNFSLTVEPSGEVYAKDSNNIYHKDSNLLKVFDVMDEPFAKENIINDTTYALVEDNLIYIEEYNYYELFSYEKGLDDNYHRYDDDDLSSSATDSDDLVDIIKIMYNTLLSMQRGNYNKDIIE